MTSLDLPQIAEAQAAAYVTSNDADAALEKALCNGKLDHDATSGNFTISTSDFKENWFHRIGGVAGAPFTVTVPTTPRPFMVENNAGEDASISTGGGGSVVIADGECQLCFGDGVGVAALAISASAPIAASFSGALVSLSSNFSVPNTTVTEVDWDTADYDTDSYFAGGGTSELTVPSGVAKVILRAQVRWNSNTTSIRDVVIYKNGSGTYTGRAYANHDGRTNLVQNLTSPVLAVNPGDEFTCVVYQTSGSSQNIITDPSSWFSIEAVG
jgi:hypothetical protein